MNRNPSITKTIKLNYSLVKYNCGLKAALIPKFPVASSPKMRPYIRRRGNGGGQVVAESLEVVGLVLAIHLLFR